jgi:RNA ligase (TIGR02306 family)
LEIDAWVPTELAPFLSKGKEPKEYNGVRGEKLRTIRLRGQVSQGLAIPMIRKMGGWVLPEPHSLVMQKGDRVGDLLGVQKWEAPETFTAGNAKGTFPSFVPKTDAERIQNLRRELEHYVTQVFSFEVTEKIHGTSFTAIWRDNELTVCSRNLALKEEGEGTYWNVAKRNMLEEKFIACGVSNFAIQGEIVGPGICGNQYGLTEPTLYVFNVFDIDTKQYLSRAERVEFVDKLGLNHVPAINESFCLAGDNDPMGSAFEDGPLTIDSILTLAEGKSKINGSEREGLVFKCIEDPSIQFKAVSNKWLEKEK